MKLCARRVAYGLPWAAPTPLHGLSKLVTGVFGLWKFQQRDLSLLGELPDLLKHPYKHPYGIAPCDPQRFKRAQSTQIGSHDTVIRRIRYAVPSLI